MRKMLMLASVPSMIGQFNMSNIELLLELGYKVEVACNFKDRSVWTDEKVVSFIEKLNHLNITYHHIEITRDIKNIGGHFGAYKQIVNLLKNNNYDFIHCHSPIGGVIGRLAGYKTNTKVIYTAHGFHFFKESSVINWLLYYPIEKLCSKYTDILITINTEDYMLAKKKMKAKKILYIPGVGIDTKKFTNTAVDKKAKCKELGLPEDAIILVSVGELNNNKNHEVIIRALAHVDNPNIYYILVGIGELKDYLVNMAKKLGIIDRVLFIGYRQDVAEVLKIADAFCFPSKREGLGLAAIEAMSAGLPIITSNVHGINDYSINEETGYSNDPNDVYEFANSIKKIVGNKILMDKIGHSNIIRAKKFDVEHIKEIMKEVYKVIDCKMQ